MKLLSIKNLESEKDILHAFNEYLNYGGFPSIINLDDDTLKQDVLKGIYNSVILKDVSLN